MARVRSVFEAALTDGNSVAWTPPSPESLAPLFPAYEIGALLGRGGMGAVYRARQKSLDRPVAIKLLPFDLGVREDFAERFRREATALARLSHPHIVAVHDFGQADDGHFFMVMEYVEGSDLAARLRAGPLPPEEALAIVRQVCEALEFAHARGVVHRDIKPGNILLDAAGRVKVTDFGIAQMAGDEPRTALTVTGALLGTPEYVAPEQMLPAAAVDHRADIFSVGVMLYELLTGQLPRGVFRPLAQLVPAARTLDRVVTRALQSEPGRRYAGMREMSADLAVYHPRQRQRFAWIAALLIAAVIGAGAVVLWPSQKPAPALPAAPAPFVNSLGQRFVPAGTPGVLFATNQTRVRDFEAFAKAAMFWPGETMGVNYDGTPEGWQAARASWSDPGFPQTPEHPVVGISQFDASAFCDWLTEYERKSGRIGAADFYRLPTDAEWSVAAGLAADAHDPAGVFVWRGAFPPPPDAGNFAGEELREDERFARYPVIAGRRDAHRFTAPVGSYPPNAHGLHDLGANVSEWVQSDDPNRAQLRGANWWDSVASSLDAGKRRTHPRSMRAFTSGFRIVLVRPSAP